MLDRTLTTLDVVVILVATDIVADVAAEAAAASVAASVAAAAAALVAAVASAAASGAAAAAAADVADVVPSKVNVLGLIGSDVGTIMLSIIVRHRFPIAIASNVVPGWVLDRVPCWDGSFHCAIGASLRSRRVLLADMTRAKIGQSIGIWSSHN